MILVKRFMLRKVTGDWLLVAGEEKELKREDG
jgi:hypothetical protein